MSLRKRQPTPTLSSWYSAALILVLLGGPGLSACKQAPMGPRKMHIQRQEPARRAPTPRQRRALGQQLLSTLGVARSHHRRADIYVLQGKLPLALKELNALLKLRFPKGYRPGEEMLLDAWGRKALLQLKHNQEKEALQTIDEALKRPTWLRLSFYRAQLHHIHGQILAKAKQPQAALEAFQRSIAHNKAVIREAQSILDNKMVGAPLRQGVPR